MLRFLARKPDAYHQEIVQFLADAFELKTTQATISRVLKRLGIVRVHRKRPPPGEHGHHLGGDQGEDGLGKILRGPGPRPSMLTEIRSVDPALQYTSPYSGTRTSETRTNETAALGIVDKST